MANQVVFLVDAKHEAALRKWQQVQAAIDATDASLKRMGQSASAAGSNMAGKLDATVRGLSEAAAGITGVSAGIGTLLAIVSLMKAEFQLGRTRQQGFAGMAQESAGGTRLLAQAFSGSPADLQQFKNKLLDKSHGVAPGVVQRAAGGLISAGGGAVDNEQILEITDRVTEYLGSKADASQIEQFGRGVIEALKKNKGQSVEAAIGNMIAVQQASLASDVATVAANASPAIGSLMQQGWSQNRASAFIAATSQVSGDQRMEQTGTAGTKAGEWMAKLKQKHGLKSPQVAGMAMDEYIEFVRSSSDQEAVDARIRIAGEGGSGEGEFVGKKLDNRLRSLKRRKFKALEEVPGEAQTAKAIRDYFTPNWAQDPGAHGFTMAEMVAKAEAAMPKSDAEAEAVYRKSLQTMLRDSQVKVERTAASGEDTKQRQARANNAQAILGAGRKDFDEILNTNIGGGIIDSQFLQFQEWQEFRNFQPKTEEEANQKLGEFYQKQIQRIRTAVDRSKYSTLFGIGPDSPQEKALPLLEEKRDEFFREAGSIGPSQTPSRSGILTQPAVMEHRVKVDIGPIQVEDPAGRPMGRHHQRPSGIQANKYID